MGWYGQFLVPKLKLAFSLRSKSEDLLHSNFESMDRFFDRYEKLRDDISYIQESAEENKNFSAKAIARMFNIIDQIGYLPESSDSVFLLYFLNKLKFDIQYYSEDKLDMDKSKKKGWIVVD